MRVGPFFAIFNKFFKFGRATDYTTGIMVRIIDYLVRRVRILPVDLNNAWWHVIWLQRWYVVLVFVGEVIAKTFNTLLPMLFGAVLITKQWHQFTYLFIAWIAVALLSFLARQYNTILQQQCVHSVHFNAHQWFLRIDPIYHARRESGRIIGKIDQSSRAYDDLIDELSFEVIPTIIGAITAVAAVAHYAGILGLAVFGMLMSMALINVWATLYIVTPIEQRVIQRDDEVRATSVENLAQVHLIRASFASNEINTKLMDKDTAMMREECYKSLMSQLLYTANKFIYIGSVLALGIYVMYALNNDTLDAVAGTALLLTYLRGTYDIIRFEKPLRKTTKALVRIQDLYTFARSFGKQTYPVLTTRASIERLPEISAAGTVSIAAQELFFDYNANAKIFNGHSFVLSVAPDQHNKLYGIIGPSGVGKSTFLHILGGQLHPAQGTVTINGIDIYAVDDRVRQRLIALQGQVATNMRGTLRYNLLFGISDGGAQYTDEDLRTVLDQVGLWQLFAHKDGLETFVGEGGLNLSGGQRQRLNFANLYLRARHYRPALILIDEPTSSLDELSEQAITQMICKLAQDAVVLIIAHRLKTIEDAAGIIDFSLLSQELTLKPYSKQELTTRSAYFQKLLHGVVTIEE